MEAKFRVDQALTLRSIFVVDASFAQCGFACRRHSIQIQHRCASWQFVTLTSSAHLFEQSTKVWRLIGVMPV